MDPSLDQLVVFAARGGDLTLLRERVAAGGSINYFDSWHGSALSAAIHRADLPMLDWLIQNGANVDADYGDAVGPLEIALHSPNPSVVKKLVYSGARLKRTARPYYRHRLDECLRAPDDADT